MYLVIDVGNTRVKSAVFSKEVIIKQFVFEKSQILIEIKNIVNTYDVESGIISSVGKLSVLELEQLQQVLKLTELTSLAKVPFVNLYKTPTTLGVDRIALVSGGVKNFPKENILIIDAGTCVTFDFVNKNGEYLGGAISPGIRLRYKALHNYTAKLPMLETEELKSFIGNDTDTSIHSGVVNGLIKEIDGVVQQYQQKFKDLTVVLTGGDTFFLSKQLKSSIFANPNLVLEGLYTILIYNNTK